MKKSRKSFKEKHISWKQKIMNEVTGLDMKNVWFSHSKILGVVQAAYGDKHNIDNLSPYLNGLVRTGHVERSVMTNDMKEKIYGFHVYGKIFIYRWTGRSYSDDKSFVTKLGMHNKKLDPERFYRGREIYNKYRKLPKWYRDMMH